MTMQNTRPLAVVTGASSGIGFELARQFGTNGFDLVVVAEDDGINTVATRLNLTEASVLPVKVDLASDEGVHALMQAIRDTGRPVDSVAINAGIGVGGPFEETDLALELKMIDLNVRSSVHLAKHIVPGLIAQGGGRILFTSSIAAVMPAPFEAVYGATKAFLLSFSEALRNELKDHGVTVTALMPGPTETNFFHRAGMDNTKVGQQKKDDPAKVAQEGFEALMAGKDSVLSASLKTKMQGLMSELMPETAKAAMHRDLSEPLDHKKSA